MQSDDYSNGTRSLRDSNSEYQTTSKLSMTEPAKDFELDKTGSDLERSLDRSSPEPLDQALDASGSYNKDDDTDMYDTLSTRHVEVRSSLARNDEE